LGYSIVEILSPCPTNWKMDPVKSCKWIDTEMVKEYKPGLLTDKREEKREEKG
jgi:pyruvate/2-oxoacid:ferredoxin oxidoreductase beta subunit